MRVSGTDDALSSLWVAVPCTSQIWATPGAVCGLEVKHQHLLSLSAGNESRGAHSALLKKIPKMPPVPKPHHMGMGCPTVTVAGEHPLDPGDHPDPTMEDTVGSEEGPSHPCSLE